MEILDFRSLSTLGTSFWIFDWGEGRFTIYDLRFTIQEKHGLRLRVAMQLNCAVSRPEHLIENLKSKIP